MTKYFCHQPDDQSDELCVIKMIDGVLSHQEAAEEYFHYCIDGRESSDEDSGAKIHVCDENDEAIIFEVVVKLEPIAYIEEAKKCMENATKTRLI